MKIQHAKKRLLDSVWTTAFIAHNDKTATILSHDRDNPIGYERENDLPSGFFIESATRTAKTLVLSGSELKIRNPQFVFSYSD